MLTISTIKLLLIVLSLCFSLFINMCLIIQLIEIKHPGTFYEYEEEKPKKSKYFITL